MEFIESLQYLQQSIKSYNDSSEQRSKGLRLMTLGTRFADKLKSVDTVEGLASMMIKGNQAAFAMGIPEFASQINNMGEIKRVELLSKEGKLQDQQKASMLKGLYSDTMVLYNGNYVPLGETEEFKKVSSMDPKLQGDAYKYIYETLNTKVSQSVQYLGNNKFAYSEYAVGKNNETKLIKSLLPIGDGKYDDALREGLQILDEPTAVTQQRGVMLYEDEKDKRNFNQQLALIDAQGKKQKDLIDYQYGPGKEKENETYYKDDKKWELLKNQTQSNISGAGNAYFEAFASLVMGDANADKKLQEAVAMQSSLQNGQIKADFVKKNELAREYINKLIENEDPRALQLRVLRDYYHQNVNDLYYKTEHRRLYDKTAPGTEKIGGETKDVIMELKEDY